MARADAATGPARATPTWLVAVIAGAFGLFYAYAVWNAVAFLVDQATGPLGLNGYGWFVLSLPIVFPLAVFAAGFALGRRRPGWQFGLLMLGGLTLVAVFWLDVVAYAVVAGASMLG